MLNSVHCLINLASCAAVRQRMDRCMCGMPMYGRIIPSANILGMGPWSTYLYFSKTRTVHAEEWVKSMRRRGDIFVGIKFELDNKQRPDIPLQHAAMRRVLQLVEGLLCEAVIEPVYHATDQTFKRFEEGPSTGFWFSYSKAAVQQFGKHVGTYRLTVHRMLDLRNNDVIRRFVSDMDEPEDPDRGYTKQEFLAEPMYAMSDWTWQKTIIAHAKQLGYDALSFHDSYGAMSDKLHEVIVVFSADQVKNLHDE